MKRSFRLISLVGAAMLAASLMSAALPATGASAGLANDYHSDAFGDPMDFSNPEDLVINTNEAMFVGGSNKSISDGQLHFDAAGAFQFDPVWPGSPTAIPQGREGANKPIDADHYKRFIIRMNAPEGAPVGLRWFNCRAANSTCAGGLAWFATGGWQTYDIRIAFDGTVPSLTTPWSGQMLGLRFVGTVSGHFDIDYIRIAPDGVDGGEIVGGPSIDLRPTSKLDFATAAGNPWDLDSLGDIAEVVAIKPGYSLANNVFSGCTVGTDSTQFPGLVYNMPGNAMIDAGRFKTLTFEYSYEGAFSTQFRPGGGTFARVFWFSPDGKRHPTNSINLYPNVGVAQIRMDHPVTQFQGIEPTKGVATGAPWAGYVTSFRINPNDTRDSRCFKMGRVWLTSDDPSGTVIEIPRRPAGIPKTLALKTSKKKAKLKK